MSKKRKKGLSSNAKWGIALVVEIIVLVIMIVCYANVWLKDKLAEINVQEIDAEDIVVNEGINEDQKGYTNIALFGLDARDMSTSALEAGNRSDSIMIASINNETKEVRIISIYRDSFLEIEDEEDSWLTKVNAAYAYGGPELAINTINANLDLHITDYIAVNFQALAEAIDELGGIPIHLDSNELPMLNAAITEQISITGKNVDGIFEPGDYILNGTQATAYARIRYTAGDDYKRTERQRDVIIAMAKKAQKASLKTINSIIDEVFGDIATSFSNADLISLAAKVFDYQITGSAGFPFTKNTVTLGSKGNVVAPCTLESNVVELHKFLYNNETYEPSSTVKANSMKIQSDTGFGPNDGY